MCPSPVSQTDRQDADAAPAELSPDRGAENFPSQPHGPGGSAGWKSSTPPVLSGCARIYRRVRKRCNSARPREGSQGVGKRQHINTC